jgi:hypothetical protein
MRLFYSLNGFKNTRRAKNNYFLFLVYFRYFSGFILSRLGFFLGFFWIKSNKRLGWQPGSTGQSTWMGLTEPARPSRPPLTRSPLAIPNRQRVPRSIPASSAAALWRICFASPCASSWPWGFVVNASNRRHRNRAPLSGPRPCGLICSGWPR